MKLPELKLFLLALLIILAPAKSAVCTAFLLCLLDLVTGVLASRKQRIPITSNGLKKTVIKLVLYEVAIILAYLTTAYLTGPEMPIMNVVSGLVGLTELKSVLENLNIITGTNLLSSVIKTIQAQSSNNPPEGE